MEINPNRPIYQAIRPRTVVKNPGQKPQTLYDKISFQVVDGVLTHVGGATPTEDEWETVYLDAREFEPCELPPSQE